MVLTLPRLFILRHFLGIGSLLSHANSLEFQSKREGILSFNEMHSTNGLFSMRQYRSNDLISLEITPHCSYDYTFEDEVNTNDRSSLFYAKQPTMSFRSFYAHDV